MAVIGMNALFFVAVFVLFGDRVGEGALEGNQFWPVDMDVAGNAIATHAPDMVESRSAADKHLFRVAAPRPLCRFL